MESLRLAGLVAFLAGLAFLVFLLLYGFFVVGEEGVMSCEGWRHTLCRLRP